MLSFKQHQKLKKIKNKSLGKRRYAMPQITSENIPHFKDWLKENGIKFSTVKIKPDSLTATQKEFNIKKIEHLMASDNHKGIIMTSSDDYILDGHHRWLATILNEKSSLEVLRINLPLNKLIKTISDYSNIEKKRINEDRQHSVVRDS
jgi:hypothetical protein